MIALKFLPSESVHDLVKKLVCDPSNRDCMYRLCKKCQDKSPVFNSAENSSETIVYHQWVTEEIDRPGAKGTMYHVKVTIKKLFASNCQSFQKEFQDQIPNYLKHIYDTAYQHRFLANLRKNLRKNEVLFVMDFSQNYLCKYASEVQSVHFGASKRQIALHTGAFFLKNAKNESECVSFCTASDNLNHDAPAVWAHMQPILRLIRQKVPKVDTIHFQSDGPTTQYRNKSNFFLFRHFCKKLKLKFASYNFTAAGHGKSCADGTGGTVKCLCNRAVLNGADVISVQDILNAVRANESKIEIFEVSSEEIEKMGKILPKEIAPIPGTMKIYQLFWSKTKEDLLFANTLSCAECILSTPCKHYALFKNGVNLIPKPKTQNQEKKTKESAKPAVSSQKIGKKKNAGSKKRTFRTRSQLDFQQSHFRDLREKPLLQKMKQKLRRKNTTAELRRRRACLR